MAPKTVACSSVVVTSKGSQVEFNSGKDMITQVDLFYKWEATKPNAVYLRQPMNGQWIDYTWKEVGIQARKVASFLKEMDLPRQSNIGMISKNCAHWIIVDIAIKITGHVSVPFYPNLTPEQLSRVLEHSGCEVLFVGKLDTLDAVYNGVPKTVRKISFPISAAEGMEELGDILAKYSPLVGNPRPHPDDLDTIVYTSGTTGVPKGVMKTVRSVSLSIQATVASTQIDKMKGRYLSYLPLNHDGERTLVEGLSLINGGTIYFVESLSTFGANIRDARPTIFLAVPRIWTKFQMMVLEKIPQEKLNRLLRVPLVSCIVKSKIRKQLGLDALKFGVSGAAPIPASTLEWFSRLGIHITEGYGMTENNALASIVPEGVTRFGSVGKPIAGSEIRIDEDTKEVLFKAPWVMKGYFKNPELTAETIDADGWLHTGDMGALDDEGFLQITGRVSDMFKTAKGEYVIPVPMEKMFAENALLEQICIVGLGLPSAFCLVNLSEAAAKKDRGEIEVSLTQTMMDVNQRVADYERIASIVVTASRWTPENQYLTPTLKVRRSRLDTDYRGLLSELYASKNDKAVVFEDSI